MSARDILRINPAIHSLQKDLHARDRMDHLRIVVLAQDLDRREVQEIDRADDRDDRDVAPPTTATLPHGR